MFELIIGLIIGIAIGVKFHRIMLEIVEILTRKEPPRKEERINAAG